MASRPKRKRKSSTPAADNDQPLSSVSSTPAITSLPGPQLETMIQTCMARILPTIEDTFRQYMDDFYRQPRTEISDQNSSLPNVPIATSSIPASSLQLPPSPGLFQELTQGTMSSSSFNKPTSVSLTLGVDDRIRGKIHAGEFVKFSSLLHSQRSAQSDNYKMTEVNGQLLFQRAPEKDSIKTLNKWLEAFHIFVAVYTENHPEEISNLMCYAQIVQRIAEACGDVAALNYDEKFRQWRQTDPTSCPWQFKNVELYQEAVFAGLEYKLQKKNQPFRSPRKHRYCFTYNNLGNCPKGKSCQHPHVCQHCQGKHSKQFCPKSRKVSTIQHNATETISKNSSSSNAKQR